MERVELGGRAASHGACLTFYDELDSTNDEAKRRAQAGEPGPMWIVAARQTKGRGRLGRIWTSLDGNLHASLLLSGFGPPLVAPQLGFVAGLAAISALIDATGAGGRFALKWPNDVLLDGGKLAGILLEGVQQPPSPTAPQGGFACVIGIGVNCAFSPEGVAGPVSDLSRLPAAPSAGALFARLSDRMDETLELWAGGAGFPALRELWLARAAGLGGPIVASLGQEKIEGRFDTIDAAGRLIISTPSGARVVEAGDVLLPELCASTQPTERPR
jgi:BirA family biotin operon repressor/biotin-[acetyl-CoA-carboxylase] ligase